MRKTLRYALVGAFLAWSLLPLLWIVKMSLSSKRELFAATPDLLPERVIFTHYATVIGDPLFRRAMLNSFLIAGVTTALCLVLGGLAAYPLARLKFRARTPILIAILALAFFPTVAIIAPLFVEFRRFGLLDTYVAIILVDTVFALPLTVWIMTAFLRKLPVELEEAARIDGASVLQTFWRVMLPLAMPGIVTAGLLTFIFAWNEFLFANTFLFDQEHWPATVVIPNFASLYSVDYGAQAAASIVVTAPLVLIVLVFQRRLVAGLTAGALKG